MLHVKENPVGAGRVADVITHGFAGGAQGDLRTLGSDEKIVAQSAGSGMARNCGGDQAALMSCCRPNVPWVMVRLQLTTHCNASLRFANQAEAAA